MKKIPTRFAGYYVSEDGKVYRTVGKVNDSFAHKADNWRKSAPSRRDYHGRWISD